MQVTIDIPAELAERVAAEREGIGEIIARGLRRSWSGNSSLRREVIGFLAHQPGPGEVLAFQPSQNAIERAQKLLARNAQSALTTEEEAELDEICEVDRFVSLLKTEVLKQRAARG